MDQIKLIESAVLPESVFGTDEPNIERVYKKLIGLVHPDKHALKSEAEQKKYAGLFQKLMRLKLESKIRISLGIYGTTKKTKIEFEPFTISTKRDSYTLTELLENSDISNVYRCFNGNSDNLIFKVVKSPANNDLVKNEIDMINWVSKNHKSELYSSFYPEVVDSFILQDATKKKSQVIVLPDYYDEGFVSLFDVKQSFENNPDDEIVCRSLVWIFKRLLMGTGYLHNLGMTHGSIIPPHILVHPVSHAVKLLDWSYAVKSSNTIKAISNDYKDFYPVEVFNKVIPTGETDIFMIVKTLLWLVDENRMPLFMKRFFKGCLSHRHYDAWGLYEEFDQSVSDYYGEPKYIELII